MDTVSLNRTLGRDIIPNLIPTPGEGSLNTILLVEEQAGPAELSPKKNATITISPRESAEGGDDHSPVIPTLNIGGDGIPTAVGANFPSGIPSNFTTKKQKQMEKERKKQAAMAEVNIQMKKWKRLCEPVFTGSARAEINLVPGTDKVIPDDIMKEYKQMVHQMDSGKVLKGAWDSQVQMGQVPDTREG
jgi:hypothetical protein